MKRIVGILFALALVLNLSLVMAMPAAVRASGSVIFDDQFGDPILSPDWVTSPGKGSYSLTDNPGYLRYVIDAYGWSGGAVPLQLMRPFCGERWILTTAITYNMRPAAPTNNRNMFFVIRTSGTGVWMACPARGVGVNDGNPASNVMNLYADSAEQHIFFPNSPNPLPLERWYFEIERNGDYIALRASDDGNDSTFEYEKEYTFPSGVLGSDQEVSIMGTGWYGSNDPPGYADIDFVKAECTSEIVTSTGTGTASFTTSQGNIAELAAVETPPSPPVEFPHGMFNFTICCLNPGDEVLLTVTLPTAAPRGTKWYKYNGGAWDPMDIGSDDGDNIITVTLKDGSPLALTGDTDGSENGQITDPSGPGYPAVGWEAYPINKVRALLPWIALFAAIMAGVSLLVLRRRRAQT
jgi:hypothetical protein